MSADFSLQVALVQCFPKTDMRTIYGPPKILKLVRGNFFGPITLSKMVRLTILGSAGKNSCFYDPLLEKVWEALPGQLICLQINIFTDPL